MTKWFVFIFLLLAVLFLVPASEQAKAARFWGTMSAHPEKTSAWSMARNGVDLERINMIWSDGNCTQGSCSPNNRFQGHTNRFWKRYDNLFLSRARAGIRIIPDLYGSTPQYTGTIHRFPKTSSKAFVYWRNFAAAAVLRYGPDGVFWQNNKKYAQYAVNRWEIWNEPNLAINNPSSKYPAKEYALFLQAATASIRWADPEAKIILGGLAQNGDAEFLASMKNRVPDIENSYDAIGVHPYDRTVQGVLEKIAEVKAEAGDKDLWINELGWATADPSKPVSPLVVTPAEQAARLRDSFRAIWQQRDSLNILGVFWYLWQDTNSSIYNSLSWDSFCGLSDYRQRAKPALVEYRKLATTLEG